MRKWFIVGGFFCSFLVMILFVQVNNQAEAVDVCNWSCSKEWCWGSNSGQGDGCANKFVPCGQSCASRYSECSVNHGTFYTSGNPDCQALYNMGAGYCTNHGETLPQPKPDPDPDPDPDPECNTVTKTRTGTNTCSYWDNVDWGICDLTTGTQEAVQVLRNKSCTWSCSCTCQDCGSGCSCSCSSSCDPGCPANDPISRTCGTCGDGVVANSVKPTDPSGLCPGITPVWPPSNVDDFTFNDYNWMDTRTDGAGETVLLRDPFDISGGTLENPDSFQCNPFDSTYLDLTCEECDDGFCGSDKCYGPVHGEEYACRYRPGNCGDGVVQFTEVCDDPGGICNLSCTAFSTCGDGEINQPYNGDGIEEECDPGDPNIAEGECDENCKWVNEGYIQEVLPD